VAHAPQQLALLPEACAPPRERVPGKRGRGATPVYLRVVSLPEPNAIGRVKLTFRYRRLQAWDPDRLAVVEGLLERYFQAFGGFRRVNDAIVRAWYEALDDFTAEQIVWACKAKLSRLTSGTPDEVRKKLDFIAAPEKAPEYFGRWLVWSTEYQEKLERERAGARARELDAVRIASAQRDAEQRAQQSQEWRERQAQEEAERTQRLAERDARRRAYWESLSTNQRRVAFKAIEPTWLDRCKQWGANPEDPTLDQVHMDLAINWAQFQWPPRDVRPNALLAQEATA